MKDRFKKLQNYNLYIIYQLFKLQKIIKLISISKIIDLFIDIFIYMII